MSHKDKDITHKCFTNVWDALKARPEPAQNITLRSTLMRGLLGHIARAMLNSVDAANLFGMTQPLNSNLTHGKIDLFTLDTLVTTAAAADMRSEMQLSKAASSSAPAVSRHAVDF